MGYTTGTICASAYANTFMAQFEKQHIYPYIKNKSILYLRYIDDIFMIWTGTKQELLIFLEKLNSKHKTIKFEHNISNSNISFLDMLIYKDKNNTLQTTLYRKPTDQQSYLHAHSDHPKSLKRSIPYSQALRIKTICSTLTEYKKHCAILKHNFIERGYEENILKDEIDEVDNIHRKELIRKKEKNIKYRIPCLMTYNRKLSMMCKIINKHWNILQINAKLQETFQNNLFVAFKRKKNLQEIIAGHTIKNGKVFKAHSKNRKGKSEPCNKSKPSLSCKQVIDTSTFRSYQTQQLYTIFHKLKCKSKFIIYLIECASCRAQ